LRHQDNREPRDPLGRVSDRWVGQQIGLRVALTLCDGRLVCQH